MKCNVGGGDRIVRIVLGIAMMGAGVYFQNWLGAIGLVPVLTASASRCPLYLPFGLSTCKAETARATR